MMGGSMEELMPCPFCGGRALMHRRAYCDASGAVAKEAYQVSCRDCGAKGPECWDERAAAERWDRRAL